MDRVFGCSNSNSSSSSRRMVHTIQYNILYCTYIMYLLTYLGNGWSTSRRGPRPRVVCPKPFGQFMLKAPTRAATLYSDTAYYYRAKGRARGGLVIDQGLLLFSLFSSMLPYAIILFMFSHLSKHDTPSQRSLVRLMFFCVRIVSPRIPIIQVILLGSPSLFIITCL